MTLIQCDKVDVIIMSEWRSSNFVAPGNSISIQIGWLNQLKLNYDEFGFVDADGKVIKTLSLVAV